MSQTMVKQKKGAERYDLGLPPRSMFRRVAFGAVLFLLFMMPLLLWMASVSTAYALHSVVVQLSLFWFPLWAVFALWAALNADVLYALVGPRPDPLGPKAFMLSGLAIANIIAIFLFLILTK